jgi:FMN phosphatase YigB (HAD superfamily)
MRFFIGIVKQNKGVFMIDTLLFDYDGTLLQVNQDEFMQIYFTALTAKVVEHGIDAQQFKIGIYKGIQAMTANDGQRTNKHVFWDAFAAIVGEQSRELEPVLQSFYSNEFNIVAEKMQIKTNHQALMQRLKEQGYTLVLASNPVFPLVGVQTRLAWIGLTTDDFDLITHYENFSYCKPNLNYYDQIFQSVNKQANQCLMIGNDMKDDACAAKLGAKIYMATDLYSKDQLIGLENIAHGSFADIEKYIESLQ